MALLWVIPWPADGTVKDYAMNVQHVIEKKLQIGDVHLVFDITIIVPRVSQEVPELPEQAGYTNCN